MALYRYSRWDGTQEIEAFSATELMDHLADRILDGRDLWSAMRDLLQRGARLHSGRQMPGLRDLLEQLKQRRQQQLQRYNLDSAMEGIKEKLEQIVDTERQTLQKRLDETESENGEKGGEGEEFREMLENLARRRLDQLENLPPQVGGQIKELRDYDFMDPEARQQFQELLESLQKQVREQYFEGMKQALGAMTPEMMGQVQEMVRDLNELLEQHRQGDDSGFNEFMNKWRQFFPDGIENVDQLAQHLQQQMEAMQSLLDSMTPEMRSELDQMLGELFQSPELQNELAELMYNLDEIVPSDRRDPVPFSGDDPITLQE